MTIVRGFRILASPCCGAQYAYPRYVSMNFSAFEYWTDGWREWSTMPNDEGLRRCMCGQYVLLKDMLAVGLAETSELPYIDCVPSADLPECAAKACSAEIEVAARLGYWRQLNHPYRQKYRQHRDAQDAAAKAAWAATRPLRSTLWDRLRGRTAACYSRPPGSPFTYPVFVATGYQLQNMQRLSHLLLEVGGASHTMPLAELYREQGRFDEAERVISTLGEQDANVASRLIASLIAEKQTAPTRYRA